MFWDELDGSIRSEYIGYIKSKHEIGHLLYVRDTNNWTLLTSHSLLGKQSGRFIKVELKDIEDTDFGIVKNMDNVPLLLKVKSRFKNYELEYESNSPGLALIESLDYILTHWERNAIDVG